MTMTRKQAHAGVGDNNISDPDHEDCDDDDYDADHDKNHDDNNNDDDDDKEPGTCRCGQRLAFADMRPTSSFTLPSRPPLAIMTMMMKMKMKIMMMMMITLHHSSSTC